MKVAFVKERKDGEDPYEREFEGNGWSCSFVSPHTVEYMDSSLVEEALILRDGGGWDGIIFTSKNAVAIVLRNRLILPDAGTSPWNLLLQRPCFVVGGQTAQRAVATGFTNVIGSQTGNAEELSQCIVSHFTATMPMPTHAVNLLFCCGVDRLKTIEEVLPRSGLKVVPIEVYKTVPTRDFTRLLNQAIPDWIVYFSPSGVDITLPHFQALGWLKTSKFAAIGPTTSKHMAKKGLPVAAVAQKPNPASLLQSLTRILEEGEKDPKGNLTG